MNIDAIPIGKNPPDDLNVIIEVPMGGEPIKYEIDKASGALFVDRFLYTPMRYPGNYGFVPHTLSDDGDPCDVIGLNPFGASAPGKKVLEELGFGVDNVVKRARALVERARKSQPALAGKGK